MDELINLIKSVMGFVSFHTKYEADYDATTDTYTNGAAVGKKSEEFSLVKLVANAGIAYLVAKI